ncbi:MAG: phosphoribosylglycinamide formyltransferase [Clostridia bacterium]
MTNIVVMVSGNGSDLQSVIDGINNGKIDGKIMLVISSRSGVYAEQRALLCNIPYEVYERRNYSSGEEMFSKIESRLIEVKAELIVLAGYISIIPNSIVNRFRGRIINIHPSLIPKHCGKGYYGLKVHQSVIDSGDKESGVTIHFVNEDADNGQIIYQEKVCVNENDSAETLQARILEVEHRILPIIVSSLCDEIKKTQ